PCLNALARSDGIYLEDLEGRRYMDFHGNSVHQVGFGNPAVIAAVKAQLDELSFCTRRYTNARAVELARKLAQITPGDLGKSLFCPSGAAAIGMALRLARVVTGRHKTVSMWDSFHGASLEASSVGGERMFASEHWGVVPDILVLGKGLGGGILPMAAIVTRPDLDVMPDRSLGHYTHEKNPVTCAAALATIDYIEREGLVDRARDLGVHAL